MERRTRKETGERGRRRKLGEKTEKGSNCAIK